jgi:hypothetical protein
LNINECFACALHFFQNIGIHHMNTSREAERG